MTERANDLVLAYRVLSQTQDRLIIRGSAAEHVVVVIVLLLGTAIFAPLLCYGLYAEARHPGAMGEDFVLKELGIDKPESDSLGYRVLAIGCSWLALLFFGVMLLFCVRKLYRKVAHGRAEMILDRARNALTFAKEHVCPLRSITHVEIAQGEVDGASRYCVDLASEDPMRRMEEVRTAVREDLLAFQRQADAEQFARRMATFLHVDVVPVPREDSGASD